MCFGGVIQKVKSCLFVSALPHLDLSPPMKGYSPELFEIDSSFDEVLLS